MFFKTTQQCEHAAKAGDVILSAEALKYVREDVEGAPQRDHPEVFVVKRVLRTVRHQSIKGKNQQSVPSFTLPIVP